MYKAHRDYRFEYAVDVIEFIEENQCGDCIFSTAEDYGPMCPEIATELILEHPLDVLDDLGDNGVMCRKQVKHDAHPDQMRIFDA